MVIGPHRWLSGVLEGGCQTKSLRRRKGRVGLPPTDGREVESPPVVEVVGVSGGEIEAASGIQSGRSL